MVCVRLYGLWFQVLCLADQAGMRGTVRLSFFTEIVCNHVFVIEIVCSHVFVIEIVCSHVFVIEIVCNHVFV